MKLQFTIPHNNIKKIGNIHVENLVCFESDIFQSEYIDLNLPGGSYTGYTVDDNLLIIPSSANPDTVINEDIFKFVEVLCDNVGIIGFFDRFICDELNDVIDNVCLEITPLPRIVSISEIKYLPPLLYNGANFGIVASSETAGDGCVNYLFVSDRAALITGGRTQEDKFHLSQ